MADLAEREGARTEYVPSLGQPLRPHRDAAALARVGAIARDFRPDIVHTHTAKAGFVGRTAALRLRPRPALVHTFHGHVLEGYFGPAKNRLYRYLERTLARRTDRLVGVSEATVADLVRLGVAPRERFDVVPLGLELGRFAELDDAAGHEVRARLGIEADEVVLGFVGRLVEIKRVDLLLRALSQARSDGRRLRLLVVGDGELRPRLEALAHELGTADAVSFLGYRRDLPAIAAATDIAVLASANEGTPVALIEAAAAGIPAVATRVGGVGDVVTPETGVVVEPGDAEALAVAITALAGDREWRERLGAAARKRALRRYSAERLVADVEALYDRLLQSR